MDADTQGTPAPAGPETTAGARSRRRFLEAVIAIFTSLITVALAVPFLGSIIGSSYRARKGLFAKAASLAGLPVGRPVDVAFKEMSSDGFIRSEAVRHVWVVRTSATAASVFSPICPHLGCRYDWDPADSLFKCPCHGSVFRMDGTVVSGPAPRPLDTLPIEIRQGELYIEWRQYEVGVAEKKQV